MGLASFGAAAVVGTIALAQSCAPAPPPFKDCTATSCPAVAVAGTPTRAIGVSDPSIRKAKDGTGWMAWSEPFTGSGGRIRVDTHLAKLVGGRWQDQRTLWGSTDTGSSVTNTETPSIAQDPTTGAWYGAHWLYVHDTQNRVVSWRTEITTATATEGPAGLAGPAETTLVGVSGTTIAVGAAAIVHLDRLNPAASTCDFMEPALNITKGVLYLAVSCVDFSGGAEHPDRELVALYEVANPTVPPSRWTWTWVGKLTNGPADAKALGDWLGGKVGRAIDATNVLQTDLVTGADGSTYALFSPSAPDTGLNDHFGCTAVKVTDLTRAALQRDAAGRPVVAAGASTSDLLADRETLSGPAACAYAAVGAGHVVLVRRGWTTGTGGRWRLVDTGIRL